MITTIQKKKGIAIVALVLIGGLVAKAMSMNVEKTEGSSGFATWWNNLFNKKTTQTATAITASSAVSTTHRIIRLTTTGIYTIPSATNWFNIINKGTTDVPTVALGSGTASKLYANDPLFIEKDKDNNILPSVIVNGNGEEVLIEYSINS